MNMKNKAYLFPIALLAILNSAANANSAQPKKFKHCASSQANATVMVELTRAQSVMAQATGSATGRNATGWVEAHVKRNGNVCSSSGRKYGSGEQKAEASCGWFTLAPGKHKFTVDVQNQNADAKTARICVTTRS